ncbi:MAG: hypothetical protein ACRBB4_05030 [Neptuniibacter sp.]
MKIDLAELLTDQERYSLYMAHECFPTAKSIDPTMLSNGIGDLNLSHIKELEQYDRVLVIGINDESEGEENEA